MNRLVQMMGGVIQKVIDRAMGNGLMQLENEASGERYITPGISDVARQSAAESCVLLKNDGVLPLRSKKPLAAFGRCQLDWFYVGYGSGGDVHPPYRVNLMEGLKNGSVAYDEPLAEAYRAWCNSPEHKAYHGWWGHWPMSHPETPLDQTIIEGAASRCDVALMVVGRAAGEDRDNTLTEGSYYLTKEEKSLIERISHAFKKTIVLLNIGGVMDMTWTEDAGISAAMIVWQGGMESGNAVCDVLSGRVNPSGRLADTIARAYDDYPTGENFGKKASTTYAEDIFVGYRYFEAFAKERILYPFGFGLSYTTFSIGGISCARQEDGVCVKAILTNTGDCAGREVVKLWCAAPQGALGKPERVLTAFMKTKLLEPGEKEAIQLLCDERMLCSYDDTGKSGYQHAFVLERGAYRFYLNETYAGEWTQEKTALIEPCEPALSVQSPFMRRTRTGNETVPAGNVDLRARILSRLPAEISCDDARRISFEDVVDGKQTMESFVAQLSDDELEALTRGEGGMNSSLGTAGNAGAFGGVLPSLREKGVPPVVTADGPAGLRLQKYTTLMPCATALACTWDTALVETLFTLIGKEMAHYRVDVMLAPALNIHRSPLCGRNFEYYAEDPVLAGKMAAATVRGMQAQGGSACPKHFACNNQEYMRSVNDSRVSERALREIYLRAFELCVKEGRPKALMTSYNKINGVWAHYNYDLVTTILRGEWGYNGVVITDWWMQKSCSPEFASVRDNAYRVRAQVDVLMPGNMGHVQRTYQSDGTLLASLGKPEGLTRGELQRTAKNVLEFIIKTKFEEGVR